MKTLTATAKELAWKAYSDGIQKMCPVKIEENDIREGFENWWSNNYGNRDTVQFNPKYNVYIEGKKYIQAE